MMGVDIPTRAFGAGWMDYRVFTMTTAALLVACMLLGGLLGDYFGRRRVLLLATVITAVGGLLTMLAPEQMWLVVARSIGLAGGAIALPLTLAVIRLSFAGRDRVRATLILPTVATAVGSVLVWRAISPKAGRPRASWTWQRRHRRDQAIPGYRAGCL